MDHARRFDGVPSAGPFTPDQVIEEFGEGLVLRRASARDADALIAFNTAVHADPPGFEPAHNVGAWTRELVSGSHPRASAADFTLVEDTRSGKIASSLCLLSHRLSMAGIEFEAGQPELVGTHPEHRRRGHVARQFDVIHRWSDERGQRAQLIEGIPWYYRRFGYEFALELDAGRAAPRAYLPARPDARAADVRVRDATPEDAALLCELHDRAAQRWLVSCRRSKDFWRYEIERRRSGVAAARVRVLETDGGEPLAGIQQGAQLNKGRLWVLLLEAVDPGAWPRIATAVLHSLRRSGEALAREHGGEFEAVRFNLGTEHPLYRVAGSRLPDERPPYAFYVRVPDLRGFVELLAPLLGRRLAGSDYQGYDGRLDLSLYESGLRLVFEKGGLAAVEEWQPSTDVRGDVAFPGLCFLQLLFGFRSLTELRAAWPDCMPWNPAATALVDTLFPSQPSRVLLTE